ncbi:MAG: cbb3-type cytochrome c oxidase subunit I [Candidatus Melainabacteria bacterium]|nr:cbb3-type cytochrome c oxidase subunit I [Candidatus Melainabacteria bacterium]
MTEARPQPIPDNSDVPDVEFGLIKAHALAAIVTLLISVAFGILVSMKLHTPDFAGAHPLLTWGRLRYNHTQGIFFGWLGNAFWMFLYYAVPMLAMRPVVSKNLGWALFILWNFAVVLPGWVLVLMGISQPLEWGEFPLIVDAFVVLAFVVSTIQFVVPLLKAKLSKLYVSGWYILGSLIFTLLAYPVGNIVPQLLPGAQGAAFSGLWIHDAIGLYVTPLALAITFLVVPLATKKPIYSHFLSMLGFWLLFFVYPLNGTHHYVFSSIPMDAQKQAIVASVYLGMDVILVVTNLLVSMRGCMKQLGPDIALRFVWMGTILYLIVSLQGSMQALMPFNRLLHFSDWVIGHSHLAMLGFATFTAIGGMAFVWQRVPGVRFNKRALAHAYWLLLIGMALMVSLLTAAGLIEARLWQTNLPWLESVRVAKDYWLFRSLTAILIGGGFISLLVAFVTGKSTNELLSESATDVSKLDEEQTAITKDETEVKVSETKPASQEQAALPKRLGMAYAAAGIGGIGFFLLSFGILAIIPGFALQSEIARTKPATMLPPGEQEERGRVVYAREGCAYCHTQQIRTVPQDVQRFGAPTKAWENRYDYPHLWGTRRVGPDLSRETSIRSDDWQLTHLYNPRFIVPDSVMPAFPWLFDGSPAMPNKDAEDLLVYIKSLGKARQLAGDDPKQWTLAKDCDCPEDVKKIETTPVPLDASSATRRAQGPVMEIKLPKDPANLAELQRKGAQVFAKNCQGCHGEMGDGQGPAAEGLLPRPAGLIEANYTTKHLVSVLMNGVPGTSMPAWRDLPKDQIEALIAHLKILPERKVYVTSKEEFASKEVQEGKKIYEQKCVSCHGIAGDGNGPAAATLDRRPTNFKEVQPEPDDLLTVLEEGVPGTSMPPWKDQLTEQERDYLSRYVQTFFVEEPIK